MGLGEGDIVMQITIARVPGKAPLTIGYRHFSQLRGDPALRVSLTGSLA
jgi:hypothetical protein